MFIDFQWQKYGKYKTGYDKVDWNDDKPWHPIYHGT
jgi:hypothetical protein